MVLLRSTLLLVASLGLASATGCPYGHSSGHPEAETLERRAAPEGQASIVSQFTVDDSNSYLTSDAGGPITDQNSLTAGEGGPTLLEDFIFRQKITHFDHERVPERAVHARGAGAHGTFESYGDFSNITAASFLKQRGKKTPVFVRFSTVAGSRGSPDTARDVHGFAARFYTDEGNFDIVGNNIPVFFIQDAIQFPDLIHAVKPQQDREIPQAATAHDSAWDFFSQQPSTLHTLFWAMAGQGIVRSYRHMDGFGVHTFRFVNEQGRSKLVKFHFTSLTGKASVMWEEAQTISGKNADYHRADLWDSIANGQFPEWEFGVQVINEEDSQKYGFDLHDPTKFLNFADVPITKLGKLTLNRNPSNYFAETEQIMFQPGHIVRGVDFSDDSLLQGRIFSYLDTQINRHGNANFEQLPINRPVNPVHTNQRDGAGQMLIHTNNAPYSPNTLNSGSPKQANQASGKGFFTAPQRQVSGKLVRSTRASYSKDYWSQPRQFYNSLLPEEQQFLINAIRFEASQLQSETVKRNVLNQLNKIHNGIASKVAETLGMPAPKADSTFYHDRTFKDVSTFATPLKKLHGLKVGILTTNKAIDTATINNIRNALKPEGVSVVVVAESLAPGVDQTYSASDAIQFDGVIIAKGASALFASATKASSPLFPAGRPVQILIDSYRYGKPVGFAGDAASVQSTHSIPSGPGVYVEGAVTPVPGQAAFAGKAAASGKSSGKDRNRVAEDLPISQETLEKRAEAAAADLAGQFKEGLKQFRFLNRFPVEK